MTIHEPDFHDVHLRMSQSSFTLTTSDQSTKIIHFQIHLPVSWMLWKTEFQINSYHTTSSDENFTKQLNRIMSYDAAHSYHGTVAETQYASGNTA